MVTFVVIFIYVLFYSDIDSIELSQVRILCLVSTRYNRLSVHMIQAIETNNRFDSYLITTQEINIKFLVTTGINCIGYYKGL